LLSSGKHVVVSLDSLHPKTNRIELATQEHLPASSPAPDVLAWIAAHDGSETYIGWQNDQGSRDYDNWTAAEKDALSAAFEKAWSGLPSGLPDAPVNMAAAEFPNSATILQDKDAFALYVAHLAQTLALEIGGRVNWSYLDYGELDRERIVGNHSMFW